MSISHSIIIIRKPSRLLLFSLGFRSTLPRGAGCFCTVDLNLYGHILGTALSQRFGFANMKSNAHLNLQYKT